MKKVALIFASIAVVMVLVAFTGTGDPWDIPAKYQSMKNPVKADKETLAIGKQLYNKHCKSCHGSEGLGDGTKAAECDSEVPDITTDEYKSQKPGMKYFKSIIGRDDMPNYEKKIRDEEDRWSVINYMDTF